MRYEDNEAEKIAAIRSILPYLLPLLMECCKFTESDKANMMPSQDKDVDIDNEEEEIEEDGEEKTGDDNEIITTLRKSSAFTLERLSKIFHDDVFFILQPHLEKAVAEK